MSNTEWEFQEMDRAHEARLERADVQRNAGGWKDCEPVGSLPHESCPECDQEAIEEMAELEEVELDAAAMDEADQWVRDNDPTYAQGAAGIGEVG